VFGGVARPAGLRDCEQLRSRRRPAAAGSGRHSRRWKPASWCRRPIAARSRRSAWSQRSAAAWRDGTRSYSAPTATRGLPATASGLPAAAAGLPATTRLWSAAARLSAPAGLLLSPGLRPLLPLRSGVRLLRSVRLRPVLAAAVVVNGNRLA